MKEEDFIWVQQPIMGGALLVMQGEIDSRNEKIMFDSYYRVGKHKISGKVMIIPVDK